MILIWWPLGVNNQTEVEGYYIENRFAPTLSWSLERTSRIAAADEPESRW
jgi:hypothetical protein